MDDSSNQQVRIDCDSACFLYYEDKLLLHYCSCQVFIAVCLVCLCMKCFSAVECRSITTFTYISEDVLCCISCACFVCASVLLHGSRVQWYDKVIAAENGQRVVYKWREHDTRYMVIHDMQYLIRGAVCWSLAEAMDMVWDLQKSSPCHLGCIPVPGICHSFLVNLHKQVFNFFLLYTALIDFCMYAVREYSPSVARFLRLLNWTSGCIMQPYSTIHVHQSTEPIADWGHGKMSLFIGHSIKFEWLEWTELGKPECHFTYAYSFLGWRIWFFLLNSHFNC